MVDVFVVSLRRVRSNHHLAYFLRHTESMCDLLAHDIALAEADVMKACRQSLAHGAILLTRYAIQEIDFDAEKTDALQVSKVSCETHLRIDSDDENQAPSTEFQCG